MKIEEGKYYLTRDGKKVGPMRELDREQTDYPWTDQYGDLPDLRYSDSGCEIGTFSESFDLISEWKDETPSPIRTVMRKEIVPGNYGIVAITKSNKVMIAAGEYTADELHEAAHTLNQIAEALEND